MICKIWITLNCVQWI